MANNFAGTITAAFRHAEATPPFEQAPTRSFVVELDADLFSPLSRPTLSPAAPTRRHCSRGGSSPICAISASIGPCHSPAAQPDRDRTFPHEPDRHHARPVPAIGSVWRSWRPARGLLGKCSPFRRIPRAPWLLVSRRQSSERGSAQASQQAIHNAINGTWLWPPTTIDRRP
jgi:hypothetical protein